MKGIINRKEICKSASTTFFLKGKQILSLSFLDLTPSNLKLKNNFKKTVKNVYVLNRTMHNFLNRIYNNSSSYFFA